MRLPPLNALRAFEAAARHKSFARAADELCVTQGAVSRHVRLLEQHLGAALFRRRPHGVELTGRGGDLLPELTASFERIGRAARRVAEAGREIRVAAEPTVAGAGLTALSPDGILRIQVTGGKAIIYASITDNRTNDSSIELARPIR